MTEEIELNFGFTEKEKQQQNTKNSLTEDENKAYKKDKTFSYAGKQSNKSSTTSEPYRKGIPEDFYSLPLSARMRPETFENFMGQEHILGEGKLLRRAIDADKITSIILHGPAGTGKTTVAELIAKRTGCAFIRHSGVTSTVSDIRKVINEALTRKKFVQRNTILFIDEIHRFNKAQQDVLLPHIENGTIRFIGATTQNPYFYIVGALLSRSLVFRFEPLSPKHIRKILLKATKDKRGFPDKHIDIDENALDFLAEICEGDARRALNALEIAVLTTKPDKKTNIIHITIEIVKESIQKRVIEYGDDGHYDTISAFIKSMRGSDPDAAVYWLAKMLHAGEDIMFIARRLVIFASEDIGNADPKALNVTVNAMHAVDMIGMPEAQIILSHATTYCATAPKSNASYMAINKAMKDIEEHRVQPVPTALKDAHYSYAKKLGYGKDYLYPHEFEGHFVNQTYLGVKKTYYEPTEIGYEKKIKERMNYWNSLRTRKFSDNKQK